LTDESVEHLAFENFGNRFRGIPASFISVLLSASYCSRKAPQIFERQHNGREFYRIHRSHRSQAALQHVDVDSFLAQTYDADQEHYRRGHCERAQLHMLLLAPFGYQKSSAFKNLTDSALINKYSMAGLVGSINKEGEVMDGIAQAGAGKFIVFDEIQNASEEARNAMLSLFESQEYHATMGFPSRVSKKLNVTEKEFKKKLWSFDCDQGEGKFRVRSIFSACCMGLDTMANFLRASKNANNSAWLSRMTPLVLSPSVDDIYKQTRGELGFTFYRNIKPYTHPMSFEEYDRATYMHEELVRSMPFFSYFEHEKAGSLSRNLQDTVRLAAYFCASEDRSEITIEDFSIALEFQPLVLYNHITTNFTQLEHGILARVLLGQEASVIAHDLNCTVQHVYDTRTKLINMNLMRG